MCDKRYPKNSYLTATSPQEVWDSVSQMWCGINWVDRAPRNWRIDSLSVRWYQPSYVFPPQPNIKKWVAHYNRQDVSAIWLVPLRPSSLWFRSLKFDAICLPSYRLTFKLDTEIRESSFDSCIGLAKADEYQISLFVKSFTKIGPCFVSRP